MKKQLIFLFIFLMVTAGTFTAAIPQQKKNNNKDEKQPKEKTNQDKKVKADKPGQAGNANKGYNENKGGPGNNLEKQDKDVMKGNKGKNDNIVHGNNHEMKDGYKWDHKTFKLRNQIKNQEKVAVCHKFNRNDEPAVTIKVSSNAVKAHMNHGDIMGTCPSVPDSRFSDIFFRKRSDYYNAIQNHYEQEYYSRSILDYALIRLTNSRQQLAMMRSNNMPAIELERKQATVVELEQNVSLLETLIGVAATLIVDKLQ